jgi:hypothetical protein
MDRAIEPMAAKVKHAAARALDIDAGEAMLDACLARFPGLPAPMMTRAYAHALRGNAGAARALERECYSRFPHHSPSDRAHVAALLRDKPAVIVHMVAAQATHDMSYLTLSIHPALAWLADDDLRVLNRSGVPGWRGRSIDKTA